MTPHVCNIPGYKACPTCEGSGEHETGRIDPENGYHDTGVCPACEGEGTVVDEDAVCESCLLRDKVVEYDVLTEYGERFCHDCIQNQAEAAADRALERAWEREGD